MAAALPSLVLADLFSVKAIAAGFSANGAKVYITGRREDVLKVTAEQLNAQATLGGSVIPVQGDVSTKAGCEALVKAISTKEQHIDVLVNNAGVSRQIDFPSWDHNDPDAVQAALWQGMEDDHFTFTNSVNVNGVYFTSAGFVPLLRKSESPSIIVISSLAGLTNQRAMGSITYALSKAASLHLSKILAGRLSPMKIRVNCVLPGIFPSEMTASDGTVGTLNKFAVKAAARSPSGRAGKIEDIVGPCLFLSSKAGNYVNGEYICSDGGRAMGCSINDGLRMPEDTYVN
ncbi:NAD(P)-binding protein [Meredithblackwellia eburnea MCA 4105]